VAFGLLLMAYLFIKTGSYLKTAIGMALSYLILFLWAAAPSLLYMALNLLSNGTFIPPPTGQFGEFDKEAFSDYFGPQAITAVFALLSIIELSFLFFISKPGKFCRTKSSQIPILP
jgi:hypothetical protein